MTISTEPLRPTALGLDRGLEAAGFNAVGVLSRDGYDALVPAPWRAASLLPAARSAVVLATGGRAFGRAWLASPEAARADDPIDRFTRRVVEACADALGGPGTARPLFSWERRDGVFADFVALARASGLGAPGRIGLLLHPVFGPWLAIRAVLLSARTWPPTPPAADFEPCRGCPAPCVEACPGGAVGPDGFRPDACAATRRAGARCAARCDARHACVLGRAHAIAPALERRHMAASGRALARRATGSGPSASE